MTVTANVVELEYDILDVQTAANNQKNNKKHHHRPRSALTSKSSKNNLNNNNNAQSNWPADAFTPIEAIQGKPSTTNFAARKVSNFGNSSPVKPPGSAAIGKASMNRMPVQAVAMDDVFDFSKHEFPNRQQTDSKKNLPNPMPPRASTAGTRRSTPFGRFQFSPPAWQFSEKVDRDIIAFQREEEVAKFRFQHPGPYGEVVKETKPPHFVKDSPHNMTGTGNTMNTTHSKLDPDWHGTNTKQTRHGLYQPVRQKNVLPPRERLRPNTSGKIVNNDLPLYPQLKEIQDHGIHPGRWNVMTVEKDDEDRCLPSNPHQRPSTSQADFDYFYHNTRLIRGESVETRRRVEEIPSRVLSEKDPKFV